MSVSYEQAATLWSDLIQASLFWLFWRYLYTRDWALFSCCLHVKSLLISTLSQLTDSAIQMKKKTIDKMCQNTRCQTHWSLLKPECFYVELTKPKKKYSFTVRQAILHLFHVGDANLCDLVGIKQLCQKNEPSELLKADPSSESKFKCCSVPKMVPSTFSWCCDISHIRHMMGQKPVERINIIVKINQNVIKRTSRLLTFQST